MYFFMLDDILLNITTIDGSFETIVWMILIPLLWMFRIGATIGYLIPIIQTLFIDWKNDNVFHVISRFGFSIVWMLFNLAFLLNQGISLYWKWIWMDIIGSVMIIIRIVSWNNTITLSRLKKDQAYRHHKKRAI